MLDLIDYTTRVKTETGRGDPVLLVTTFCVLTTGGKLVYNLGTTE